VSLLSGLSGFGVGLGLMVAPVISAELYDRHGKSWACDFAAFVHFVYALVFFIFGGGLAVMKHPLLKQSQPPEEKTNAFSLENDEEEQEMLLHATEEPSLNPTASVSKKLL